MLASPERLTKRQKRKLRQDKVLDKSGNLNIGGNFKLSNIEPMTVTQEDVFDSWESGLHLMLHGIAGTGKTFIAMYLALRTILEEKQQKKIQYKKRLVFYRFSVFHACFFRVIS